MADDYTPVDCALYERYELAILRQDRLLVRWRDGAGLAHLEPLLPRDLETRNGVEFLIADGPKGASRRLRLDQILEVRPAESA